ncbi:MAG: DUF1573 domain-containing protein [Pirellulales bacterium]|nr:DUF1573 domain-containing protein [Pirellulales bacterium]
MPRTLFLFLLLTITQIFSAPVHAQDWARKMFKVHEHDFGTVARGSEQKFRFEITNLYKEDVVIDSVRASCGCTIPSIEKQTIKSLESGAILATYNTKSFVGSRGATVTVTISKPFFAEVQLQIEGFIRGDVVFVPGKIELGNIKHGATVTQEVTVKYAGRSSWKITDVQCDKDYYEVEIVDRSMVANQVHYRLLIRLKPEAPVGYIKDDLVLITDDADKGKLKLAVTGNVIAPVTVSPASMVLGTVPPGTQVIKRMVVKADQPFKITGITADQDGFSFEVSKEKKKVHLVPMTFVAPGEAAMINAIIRISTDIQDAPSLSSNVSVNVK